MRAVRQPSPPSVCSPVHEPSRRSSLPSFARQLDLPQVAAAADATGQKMLSVAAKRAKALRDEMHRLLRLDMSPLQGHGPERASLLPCDIVEIEAG